jgi:hypothetical protein
MSKQTAMQQLFDWIEANMDENNFDILSAKEKAIEMEKEQIVQTYKYAKSHWSKEDASAENYYNKTYKGGQDG